MDTATSVRDLLFTLLLKVGVASSIAALLARCNTFRRVLFTEQRDPDQKLKLMLFMTPALLVGVTLRLVGGPPYAFADLSLEGAFLMGLLGGRVVGPIGGAIITIPALISHEWLAMPAASTAGLLGGLIRQAIPNKEDLWNFGPFTFLNIPKATMRLLGKAQLSWEMAPLAACVGLELGRVALVLATKPKWLFALDARWDWWLALVVIATLMSVAAPLKIWNNTRIEMNLERHQQLLLKARMDALSSQINPHFLFNTLNTVTALIRFDPDSPRAESGSKRISAVTVFSVLNKKCGLIWLESASMRAFSSNCWCLSRFISMRVLFQIFSGAATDISVAITTRASHQSQRASSANSHFGLVASTSATRPSSRPTHAASGAISQDNCAFPSNRIVAFGIFRNVNGPKFQRSSLLGMACRINPPSTPAVHAAGIASH